MTKAEAALDLVQNLYLMQEEVFRIIEGNIRGNDKKEAAKHVKAFRSLLKKADWHYMGGQDVWEELSKLAQEAWSKVRN